MIQNNGDLSNLNEQDNLSSSFAESDAEQKRKQQLAEQIASANATPEEIEAANRPQPNVILDKVGGPNIELNRDMERVNARANEASDSTDTNTGGIVAGAAKGASQS